VLLETTASVVVTTGSIVNVKFLTLKAVLLKILLCEDPLPVKVTVMPELKVEVLSIVTVPPVSSPML